MNLPRPAWPLDRDDSRVLVAVLAVTVLVLWAAFIIGVAVRIFVLAANGA